MTNILPLTGPSPLQLLNDCMQSILPILTSGTLSMSWCTWGVVVVVLIFENPDSEKSTLRWLFGGGCKSNLKELICTLTI